jgi:protein disulfide-isomerase
MLRFISTVLTFLLPLGVFAAPRSSADFPTERSKNGITWLTDYENSKTCASESRKPIFVLFTGSDWCGWCKKLESEALSTKEFSQSVGDRFVFLKLDFPRAIGQSAALKEQNQQLKQKYKVRGFPTVVLFDSEMREIAQTGYQPGGGASYADHLLELSDEHHVFKARLSRFLKAPNSNDELQDLFEVARRLGEKDYKNQLLSIGIERKIPYFLLERYQELLRTKTNPAEMSAIRRTLNADSDKETHYRLAIIDFVAKSTEASSDADPSDLARPLLSYLEKYSSRDQKNRWRVQLQVSTLYNNAGKKSEAANYLKAAMDSAPPSHKEELKQALEHVESEIVR